MSESISIKNQKPRLDKYGRKRAVVVFLYFLILAVILFLAAGTREWWAAWAYVLLSVGAYFIAAFWILRKNPGIVNERGRKAKDTKPFDKVFIKLYTPLPFLMTLVAGLDFRLGWSVMPVALQIIGFVGLIPATILPYWAMAVNNYLTTTVRIQTDRGHQVCTTGPYQYVRHPMYLGAVLSAICTPLLLGSWVALLIGLLAIALFVWRTANEDRVLQAELHGYSDYAEMVRWRLIPGIW